MIILFELTVSICTVFLFTLKRVVPFFIVFCVWNGKSLVRLVEHNVLVDNYGDYYDNNYEILSNRGHQIVSSVYPGHPFKP